MNSLDKLLSVVGILGFVSGPGGFGKIQVPGRMLGAGQTSFLLLPFWWLRIRSLKLLRFWWSLISLMVSFGILGCPSFVWAGHPEVAVPQFLAFVGSFLPREAEIDLPPVSGKEFMEFVRAKQSAAGGLDGCGPGMSLKPNLFLGSLGWLSC